MSIIDVNFTRTTMIKNIIYFVLVGYGLLCFGCTNDKPKGDPDFYLKWPKAYATEDWPEVKTGLLWSLSFLGASLPKEQADKVFVRVAEDKVLFKVSEAGFNITSLNRILTMLEIMRSSNEYTKEGAIDLGRFLMLSVYSSWNYCAITGADRNLNNFKSKYNTQNGYKYVSTNSTVSKQERVITFSINKDISKMYFMAEEGTGSVTTGNFVPVEYETITIMPNGQPRFALYDKDGNLKDAGDTSLSIAGKPGKCMWCHESNIQKLFSSNMDINGYLTQQEFQLLVDSARYYLKMARLSINTVINYENLQEHALSELLYISFMEPSVYRLSKEWGMSTADVEQLVVGLSKHLNSEAPVLGDVFYRFHVESLSPYKTLPVPQWAREKSIYEPDYFDWKP